MSKVLELYKDILESKQRFVDEVFDAEIYRSSVPQLTIIDLGAYEGEFSFYCFNFAKKIYAIEPDPRPYAILEKRIKDYDLGNRIACFPIAISDSKKERIFHASGYGGSRLLAENDAEYPGKEKMKVQSMSLADFMEENNIEYVDILKVDIEGGEDELFNGLEFAKVAHKIGTIVGEIHQGFEIQKSLEKYGFTYEPWDHGFTAKRVRIRQV